LRHINLTFFLELGSSLAQLRFFAKSETAIPMLDAWPPVHDLDDKLSRMLSGDPVFLEVSNGPASNLRQTLFYLRQRHFNNANGDLDFDKDWGANTVPAWEFTLLPLDVFQNVLIAEFSNSATFCVPQRWGYHTPTLIADATVCSELTNRADFQGTARTDLREAGKCLAFHMPTASGFHSARAVEGVLHRYFQHFLGKTPPRGTMGTLLDQLDALAKKGASPLPEPKTLRTLREIKDLDRNPLAHPEATLDMLSAKALFELAGVAIMRMLVEIAPPQVVSPTP